jgi:hypothetical protein
MLIVSFNIEVEGEKSTKRIVLKINKFYLSYGVLSRLFRNRSPEPR